MRCSVKFINGKADGDAVEHKLIEKLNSFIDSIVLAQRLDVGIFVHPEIPPIDPDFGSVEPVAQSIQPYFHRLVRYFIIGVVAFGEVDEWSGEDSQDH